MNRSVYLILGLGMGEIVNTYSYNSFINLEENHNFLTKLIRIYIEIYVKIAEIKI